MRETTHILKSIGQNSLHCKMLILYLLVGSKKYFQNFFKKVLTNDKESVIHAVERLWKHIWYRLSFIMIVCNRLMTQFIVRAPFKLTKISFAVSFFVSPQNLKGGQNE